MNKQILIDELTSMKNAARIHRNRVCQFVLSNPSLIPDLVDLSFDIDNKLSIRSAWILEFVAKNSLQNIYPFLDQITSNMDHLKFDSSKRPIAKICELIVDDYNTKGISRNHLNTKNKTQIVSCCFDWLLSNEKVAVEAYSMNILFVLGKEEKWIHEELKHILINNMNHKSCGYKARGKKILKCINA
jgi:hypothetical protein